MISVLPNLQVDIPEKVGELVLGEPVVPPEEAPPVAGDHPEDDRPGMVPAVGDGWPLSPPAVDALSGPGLGHDDGLVLDAYGPAAAPPVLDQSPWSSCGTTPPSSGWPS